jgi:hypothetical protein
VTWSVVSGPGSIQGAVNMTLVTLKGNSAGTIILRGTTTGGLSDDVSVPVVPPQNVNVRVYIVRNNNGTNPATSQNRVNSHIAKANEIWEQCGIQFTLVSTSFINNSNYLNLTPGSANQIALLNEHSGTGGIEIYYVRTLAGATGGTNSNGVILTNAAIGQTAAHELGHAMGLYLGTGHPTDPISLMYAFLSATALDIKLTECNGLTMFSSN